MIVFRDLIKYWYLRLKYRKTNVILNRGAQISIDSQFEGRNRIGVNSFFSGSLGYGSYMGENCHITANIGKFCSIASRVVTARGNHPAKKWVSTHPAFFSTKKQCGITFVTEDKFLENKPPITIGNDVWIGDSALLMDGITIGDGAIIAAGAVVTRNVEPYAIVGGVPAQIIRMRFPEDTIAKLLELKWWNRPEEWILAHASDFEDTDRFFDILRRQNDGE